eukprot:GHVR01189143.1.p1 GENE.GHVR01189143.1~~GHVR01189143.1.p1  ORF type:complete len:171 (+),score=29.56 GHVR01189143.1:47-559(+)
MASKPRRVRQKLSVETLQDENGLLALYNASEDLKLSGAPNDEYKDICAIATCLDEWQKVVFPYGLHPQDFAKQIENMSSKNSMRDLLMQIRCYHKHPECRTSIESLMTQQRGELRLRREEYERNRRDAQIPRDDNIGREDRQDSFGREDRKNDHQQDDNHEDDSPSEFPF